MKIYIDGKYYDERTAKISVFDHGLLYGDGMFEGIRAYNGRVFRLKEHIDRLFYSAKAILLPIPLSHAAIMRAVVETCRANKIRDGYIRLVVTRGVGTLGLEPEPLQETVGDHHRRQNPALSAERYTTSGMEIVTVPHVRNLHSALNPAIKSLNYLNNILAKIEANNAGVRGGSDAQRRRVRGRMHWRQYLHRRRTAQLFTPPLSAGALYGITRRVVMEIAENRASRLSNPT